MAMPPTELRYRKSLRYFIIGVSGALLLTVPISFISTNGSTAAHLAYLTTGLMVIVLVVVGRILYVRASPDNPVLTFTSDGLVVASKNNRFIPWGAIQQWKTRRHKSSYTLIIYTAEQTTRVAISWLDLPVPEIERLMASYMRQPGPYGPGR